MDGGELLNRLAALGIVDPARSKRQNAILFADKLVKLGDDTAGTTLCRKVQRWLAGEDTVPALLIVIVTLLERERVLRDIADEARRKK